MLRRKSATALDQSKGDLARRESELRDEMAKLERMIEEAPRVAEELSRRQREGTLNESERRGSRLDVSLALSINATASPEPLRAEKDRFASNAGKAGLFLWSW